MKELVDTSGCAMKPISLPAGCDPDLARAVAQLARAVTPSHSITSRRFSVWSLVKRYIDQPFGDAIACVQGRPWASLLHEFVPSRAWQPPSQDVIQFASSFREVSPTRINGGRDIASRAESAISAIRQWDECLRLLGRRARTSKVLYQLVPTIDGMRLTLARLSTLRPRVERDVYGSSLKDSLTRPDQYTLCDLCWRESFRTSALRSGENRSRARRLTSRFCQTHDPRDPCSQYRADIRYKAAFKQELDALMNLGDSAFLLSFAPPHGADSQEIRKTAYDLVHSRLRPVGSVEPGLREQVAILLIGGLRQSEISRRLRITRQAVSQAKKSLDRILVARQLDAELSPRTGESLSLSGPAADELKEHVLMMIKNGSSTAQIARSLQRFRHSIRFLVTNCSN